MKKYLALLLVFHTVVKAQLLTEVKPKVEKSPSVHLKAASTYYKNEYYNLALYHVMELVKEFPGQNQKWSELVEKIVDKTGTLPLYVYPKELLSSLDGSNISLHLAHLYFKEKNYEAAINAAQKVKKEHSYYPESLLLQGVSTDLLGKEQGSQYYNACIKASERYIAFTKYTKFKRYFVLISEQCQLSLSRIHYKNGEFDKAIEEAELIDKTSYSWPYVIRDKAWAYYKLKNYNRSLGVIMTYRSPLVDSYFSPEAEMLQALNFYKLCLYQDSSLVIDQYYRVYKERADILSKMIKGNSNSNDFYFKLLATDLKDSTAVPYLKNLRAQLRKQLKINIHLGSYQKAKEELDQFTKNNANSPEIKFLSLAVSNMEKLLNQHVKEYIYYFLNTINYFSYEMLNLKLEIISRKKDLIYDNKRLISTRARGNIKNIQIPSDVSVYSFNGEFWADELGDASFGLKSNCQSVDTGVPDKISGV
jgi:tetratricopeptide (TPR) repeat protein